MSLLYGINPPKYNSKDVVFYKDLTVSVFENDEIIGAYSYRYDGNFTPASYIGIHTSGEKTYNKNIITPDYKNTRGIQREIWLYDTQEMAFCQKLIVLDYIRKEFLNDQAKRLEDFNRQIPDQITKASQIQMQKHPEYFL